MYRYLPIVFALMLWGLAFHYELGPHTENEPETEVTAPDYHVDSWVEVDHVDNYCWTRSQRFPIKVQVLYYNEAPDDLEYMGQWDSVNNIITIVPPNGLSIQTAAHEVHHMVDTMMERYAIDDWHYGAYLQGHFTECVWNIIANDI